MNVPTRADALHRDAIVVDLHADPLIAMRAVGYRLDRRHHAPWLQRLGFFHTDLPRLREGGVTAQFFGIVTAPWPGAAASTRRQIRMLRRVLPIARTSDDIRRAKREGRLAAFLGIEGGHALEGRLDLVREFHDAGVRYLGLCHFTRNALCSSSGGPGMSARRPLTGFGRAVVAEMNRLGMIVDLAHVGRQAFLDAARLSTRPVIVSHTGIHGAHALWRNVDDEQIRAVADTGGVVGIIFAWRYLGARKGGVEMLAPHFERVRRLVGARHLALGSDFDGAVEPPPGLDDASRFPEVTRLLVSLGWSDDEVRGVLGGNVLRVLDANPTT